MALIDQLQALPAQWLEMLHHRFAPAIEGLERIFHRAKDPVRSSFNLGCELMQRELFDEAKLRFKFVLWRQPQNAAAWYNLALCHFGRHETYDGLKALNKSLAFDDKNEMALYMKASYEKGQYAENFEPHTTPVQMIKTQFGLRAHYYDAEQLERGYCGDEEVGKQLESLKIKAETLLDAGCGTGLCGLLLKSHTQKLVGLDLVPEMLEYAKELEPQPYDDFIESDLRDHLLQCQTPLYDAIVSAHVMPVIGGLAAVMDGAARGLKPGGYFIFSTYAFEAMEGYRFINEIRRFAHSSAYLKAQAERAGLKAIALHESKFYEKDDRPAYLVVLQK